MISGIIEWRFNGDEASPEQREIFDTVMNYDWLAKHGIHMFDTEAIWAELDKQLSQALERSPVTKFRLTEGESNPCWDNLWTGLVIGGGQ